MRGNKIQILSTREIDPVQIKSAELFGINIDCIPFIETYPILDKEICRKIKELLDAEITVVFTSMNAVEVVVKHIGKNKPDWKIYCIGITTNKLIKEYFGNDVVIGTATNATELAGLIAEERKTNKVFFFCGDQRREELPSSLRIKGIRVEELTVYKTEEINHTINKNYTGILFFSPSAVNSFFKKNSIPSSTIIFSIGHTTAAIAQTKTNNKIIIADLPGKANLTNLMIEYFNNTSNCL